MSHIEKNEAEVPDRAPREPPEPPEAQPHRASIIALSKWLETPAGRYVLDWEQRQFDARVSDIFGYNAVQLGLLELPTLRTNRMPMIFAAGEPFAARPQAPGNIGDTLTAHKDLKPLVLTNLDELPFAAQSIDLIVLPHTLEFGEDPHRILREVERVLIPEGQVIISGFNPLSLWGARQKIGGLFDSYYLPKAGQFLALTRLKDWLKLLGFEIHRGHFGCYSPPVRSAQWLARFGFMEKAGDRWWPFCGAVYMISAVKHVHGMRLIGPAWKETRPAVRALTAAGTSSVSRKTSIPNPLQPLESQSLNDG